ncbi:MAG: hypothetical protein E6G54_06610, partial [Actinobacteria bacterium]
MGRGPSDAVRRRLRHLPGRRRRSDGPRPGRQHRPRREHLDEVCAVPEDLAHVRSHLIDTARHAETEAELRAAVEECALAQTFVAAHAHGAEGIKRAVRAGVRSIEHGSLMDDEAIELMAEHGTYLVADM